MIFVRVELWPGGDADRAVQIGAAGIANVSDLDRVSDYVVAVVSEHGEVEVRRVTGHRRSAGVWRLLARALPSRDRAAPQRVPQWVNEVGGKIVRRLVWNEALPPVAQKKIAAQLRAENAQRD